MQEVFITAIGKYLPYEPVSNDEMEEKLGFIGNARSRSKSIVLRNNKIKNRHYAIGTNGHPDLQNADLVVRAIENTLEQTDITKDDIELLSCGTSTPDQMLPSHASMVHGKWNNKSIEINSASGVCCAGMNALKYGFMAVAIGSKKNAVCTASERFSSRGKADQYNKESERLAELEKNPVIAFEKDFLRWMLSDGAGAMLLENKPGKNLSLKIHWIEGISYANEIKTCMYAGAVKDEKGDLISWTDLPPDEWLHQSVFTIKQDVKLLEANILEKGAQTTKTLFDERNLSVDDVDYFLPHISSYYFYERLYDKFAEYGIEIPWEKWFVNLDKVGNIGSASSYLQLEELYHSGKLKKGDIIILCVPESGRFSYNIAYLEVV